MHPDLTSVRDALLAGRESAAEWLDRARAAAALPASRHAFLRHFWPQAEAAAQAADHARAAGVPLPPLAGLAVSIKDLFDVAGHPTTAGSIVLPADRPAERDAAAVARLRRAGAALVGHTNMTEFAFSGVGWNPHHGTPANPVTAALDPATPRIPGGSSSGAAVSVSTGAAWAALGSDTGGSIRVPAALQGLVGFKNTARLTPLDGAVPLSTTLDTACAITHSVRDAVLLHEVLADRRVALSCRPLSGWRLAVVRTTLLDGLDTTVAAAFERTLATLRRQGARVEELELSHIEQLSQIQSSGGFAAAESWSWHRRRLATERHRYDPRVAQRIERGAAMSAADYIDLQQARSAWIASMQQTLNGYDALLSPTVPIVAPPLASITDDDAEFFRVNALLLRNPSVVNMLDGCALSLPCHGPDELPVGLMVWSTALRDDTVLDVSLAIEAALQHAGSRP
ncbi:amidase [Caldimonas brevitalea]|uniref:Amidase n=1 Tax=Caldimonas brevitalea TaxID=413882 RepID=A0A0G3BHT3_9BURK|nr:amidase [Caldimonas brevitalea]AKJ28999.1 amidase [Caldimonas brevitalea]